MCVLHTHVTCRVYYFTVYFCSLVFLVPPCVLFPVLLLLAPPHILRCQQPQCEFLYSVPAIFRGHQFLPLNAVINAGTNKARITNVSTNTANTKKKLI